MKKLASVKSSILHVPLYSNLSARVKPLGKFIVLCKSQKIITRFYDLQSWKITDRNVNTIMELSLDWCKIFWEVEEMNAKVSMWRSSFGSSQLTVEWLGKVFLFFVSNIVFKISMQWTDLANHKGDLSPWCVWRVQLFQKQINFRSYKWETLQGFYMTWKLCYQASVLGITKDGGHAFSWSLSIGYW